MSTCPVPDSSEKFNYGTPATLTATNPDPSDESCNVANENNVTQPSGASSTITQTQFCAGPQGPAGPPGASTCEDLGIFGTEITGEWATGTDYYEQGENAEFSNDYHCNASVATNATGSYVCVYGHTSGSDPDGDEPGVGLNWEFYWLPLSTNGVVEEEDRGILDIAGSFFDWITDIPNWGWGDWLQGIAGLAVAGWAVSEIADMMDFDGEGDGNAGSKYNGDPSYTGAPVNATLPNVLEHICLGMPFTVDVSEIDDNELSFKRINPIPRRNMLAQLSLAYAFSITPSGGTLRFTPYNSTPVKTLTFDDMGFDITSSDTSRYRIERKQGIDLPRKVTVTFPDRDLGYQDNTADYEIEAYVDGQEVNLQLPFVMTKSEARAIAERAVMMAHLEATKYKYTVAFDDHMELEPGDNITTPLGIHRIVGINVRSDGGMEIIAVDASFVGDMSIPSGSGVGETTASQDVVATVGYSTAIIIDMPPLNSDDKEGRMYAAVHGYGLPGWSGAGIYETKDGGGSYDLVTVARKEATVGRVSPALAAPTDYHVWDDTTTITVELKTGELTSVTDDVLYEGVKNHAMIGSEMIAFGEATLTGTSPSGNPVYELTHLLRGLQGTEWSVDDHEDNELFILLDDALVRIDYPIDERGHPRTYKIVTIGSDTSKGVVQQVTPYGLNLVPWKPSHGQGVKLGATDDWLVTWEERARFAADEIQDYAESPHDFDWAGWTITVLDDSDNIVRTEQAVKPQFTYTEAMQIEDFGTVRSCIKVKVYQMSSIVGGGYGYEFACTN